MQKQLAEYFVKDDIHVFRLLDYSNEAVDLWLNQMTELVELNKKTPPPLPVRILIDHGSLVKQPALFYLLHQIQTWRRSVLPSSISDVVIAFVLNSVFVSNLVQNFLRILKIQDNIKVFHSSEYADAISWLKSRKSLESSP
jgi:hypothetical protein